VGVLEAAEGLLGVFDGQGVRLGLPVALGQNYRLFPRGLLIEGGGGLVIADVEKIHDGLNFGVVLLGHEGNNLPEIIV